ncbi:uncharacterized protein V1518DRAFT_407470 [Limtongia smithiae]|uniref:uncharacterized protein n=1 Tax=Limtongia smithiae TaxID=1125753 RepID=UPI0034CFFAF1
MAPLTMTAITGTVGSHTVDECLAHPLTFRLARDPDDALLTVPPSSFVVLDASKKGPKKRAVLETINTVSPITNGGTKSPLKRKSETAKDELREEQEDDSNSDLEVSFKEPDEPLYPKHSLPLEWTQRYGPTPGFINNGMTCYMNSVLQVMLHVPALVDYLLHKHRSEHSSSSESESCFVCTVCTLADELYSGGNRRKPLYPRAILKRLRAGGAKFSEHRQEDAHEFLRHFIDGMQLAVAKKSLPEPVKETSVIHRIFGGRVRQQIKCRTCHYASNTYQPSLDIQLDVRRGGLSVVDGLNKFFAGEELSKVRGNAYKCSKCKAHVDATKRTLIYDAPEYLTLHLKRFDFTLRGTSKISDFVRYPKTLDLAPYSTQGKTLIYNLIGVIVHQGRRASSGHYYSFCKLSDNSWAQFNDEIVDQVTEKTVLKQEAYMLIYARAPNVQRAASPTLSSPTKRAKMSAITEQQSPMFKVKEEKVHNSTKNDENLGEVISREKFENGDIVVSKPEEEGDDDEEATAEVSDSESEDNEEDKSAKSAIARQTRAPSSPSRKKLKADDRKRIVSQKKSMIQLGSLKKAREAREARDRSFSKVGPKKKKVLSPFQPQNQLNRSPLNERAHGNGNGKLKIHHSMNGKSK